MPICVVTINPLSNLVNLVYWVALTVSIFLLFSKFTWDDRKYAFFRRKMMFISQAVLFYFVYFWLGLNGYSAWRVWFCHDWDSEPVILMFYIIKIILIAFIGPSFMLTTKIWIPIAMSCLAFAASFVSCILFFSKDDWAGLCGTVDIITLFFLLLILTHIAIFKKNTLAKWVKLSKLPNIDAFFKTKHEIVTTGSDKFIEGKRASRIRDKQIFSSK